MPVSTEERLEEALRTGDREAFDAIGKEIEGEKNAQPEEKKEEAVENEEPKTTEERGEEPTNSEEHDREATEEQKKYELDVHGEKVELPDDDGYLGRKDLDGLKKKAAHQERFIEQMKRENENYRQMLEQLKNKPEQPTVQPKRREVPVNTPEPPEPPELPSDRFDWSEDDNKKYNNYLKKQAEYNRQVSETMKRLSAQKHSDIPDTYAEKIEKLEKYINEQENKLQKDKFWNNIRQFQVQRGEYKTPKDIKDLHYELDTWADQLAFANGDRRPSDPDAQKGYEYRKMQYVKKYRDGDPDVLKAAEGVTPPEGYEQYYRLADLQAERSRLINKGELGKNASLQDAWLIHMDKTGSIEDAFNNIKTSERKKATNALSEAIEKNAGEAKPVPNNLATSSDNASQGVKADLTWFNEVLSSQEKLNTLSEAERKKLDAIAKSLNWA